jgi:peptidoglycan/LPS O-acetylase OafA/YrhL
VGVIRILLALSVVLWHVRGQHVRLLSAPVAVLMFFVISGFYMALVINEKYAPSGEDWFRRFYLARFLRLYPLYAAMCTLMVIWYWWTQNPNVFTWQLPVTTGEQAALVLLNIGVFGQDLYELMSHVGGEPIRSLFSKGFFNGEYMLVGQAWSLSPEIFFYSLAPMLVRSPARIMTLLVASLSIRFTFVAMGWTSGFWCYWFFPSTMCMFALGSLSYFLYRRVRGWRWSGPVGWCALAGMVAWMLALSIVYGVALPFDATHSLDQPRFWLAYLTFAALLPFVFRATKEVAIDRLVGDLSYPLYLVHGVVLGVTWNWMGRPQNSIVFVVAAIAASVFAAVVLRCAVELPAERCFNGAAVRALSVRSATR